MKKIIAIIACSITIQAQAYKVKTTYFPKSAIDRSGISNVNYIDSFDNDGKLLTKKEFDENGNLLFLNTYTYLDGRINSVDKKEWIYGSDPTQNKTQSLTSWYFYNNSLLQKIATVKEASTDSLFMFYDALQQPLNGRLNYKFDKQGRMIQSVSKVAKTKIKTTTKYTYNKLGKLATIQEVEGKKVIATTKFIYNATGDLVEEKYKYQRGKDQHQTATTYSYKDDLLVSETYFVDGEPADIIVYSYE